MRDALPRRLHASDLRELATQGELGGTGEDCGCRLRHAKGWESMPEERWPSQLMELQGTLRDPSIEEPTFEEFHPAGTRYESPGAPIAIDFFPFNRCDVYRCTACGLLVLRYTEYGGYYVDHRVRRVEASLIVDTV
jgi:hypothetical protein